MNAPRRARWWIYLGTAMAVVYLAFQVYAPALDGPFLFDDRDLPYGQAGQPDVLASWTNGMRPLLMFSFWLNHRFWNIPFGFHCVNVILHLLNSLLVFVIVRMLLRDRDQTLAVLAVAVFLLHPIQTEAVAYIAGRSECLSVLFFLSAFAVFLSRRRKAISWPATAAVMILFGAAMLTKEHTLVLPALLLLTDYYWNPGFSWSGIRGNWRLYAAMALACGAGAAVVVRVLAGAHTAGFAIQGLNWYQYFFTECRAIFVYLRLLVWPAGQNADWDFAVSRTILDHGALIALIALAALTVAAIYLRRRAALASYGFLVFLILLAPTSSILPIKDALAERRLYLPMIGMLLVMVAALQPLRLSNRSIAIATAAAAVLLGGLTYQRSRLWANDVALWEDTAGKSPDKARAHLQLGFAYYASGRCADAVRQYGAAGRIQAPDDRVLVDWGLACECAGDPAEALAKLREAAARHPTAHVFSQIGMVYARQSRWAEALDALDRGEKLDSNYTMIYVYRGGVRAATGDFAEAVKEYQHALALDPENQLARQGLDYARLRLGLRPRE